MQTQPLVRTPEEIVKFATDVFRNNIISVAGKPTDLAEPITLLAQGVIVAFAVCLSLFNNFAGLPGSGKTSKIAVPFARALCNLCLLSCFNVCAVKLKRELGLSFQTAHTCQTNEATQHLFKSVKKAAEEEHEPTDHFLLLVSKVSLCSVLCLLFVQSKQKKLPDELARYTLDAWATDVEHRLRRLASCSEGGNALCVFLLLMLFAGDVHRDVDILSKRLSCTRLRPVSAICYSVLRLCRCSMTCKTLSSTSNLSRTSLPTLSAPSQM